MTKYNTVLQYSICIKTIVKKIKEHLVVDDRKNGLAMKNLTSKKVILPKFYLFLNNLIVGTG